MVSGRSSSSSPASSSVSPPPPSAPTTTNNTVLPNGILCPPPPGPTQQGEILLLIPSTTTTTGMTAPANHLQGGDMILTLQEKRIIAHFSHLLEKSKQLFNQLRDLPAHFSRLGPPASSSEVGEEGSGNPTLSCQQAYFSRAFDMFTKLWKFQQLHRTTLDKKYGLKRWQIGDIASKIGQLYYHYYIRTSDLFYLQEALSFYGAIRARGYYANRSLLGRRRGQSNRSRRGDNSSAGVSPAESQSQSGQSGLILKKLRYYARFIVVSLLLRKNNLKDLLRELSVAVENYVATVDDEPEETLEWNLVLSEIRSFMEADSPVVVYDNSTDKLVDPHDQVLILNHRLPGENDAKNSVPYDLLSPKETYKLQEILIVGNKQNQLKFSELTVDMFRMAQSFERSFDPASQVEETRNLLSLGGCSIGGGGDPFTSSSSGERNKNPHKYLLYRAPIEQILLTLAAAFSDLPSNGVLLLYLSADPSLNTKGIATPNKPLKSKHFQVRQSGLMTRGGLEEGKEIHCLYPCDLVPLSRKPFVVIVDSDNSHVFLELGLREAECGFGLPLVILCSPERGRGGEDSGPGAPLSSSSRGSLFSLFLHCPLAGLCSLVGVKSLTLSTWNQLEHLLNIFLSETAERVGWEARAEGKDGKWAVYCLLMADDFLRLIILRFLFCQLLFEMHKDFQDERRRRPGAYPELSLGGTTDTVGLHTNRFQELIYEMTDLISSKHLFNHHL